MSLGGGGGSRFLKSKQKDPFQSELSSKLESRNKFSSGLLSDSENDDNDDLLTQYSLTYANKSTVSSRGNSWQPGSTSSRTDSAGLSQYMPKPTEKETPKPNETQPASAEELIFGKDAVEKAKIKEAKRTKVYQPPSYSRKFDEDDEEEEELQDKSGSFRERDSPMMKTMRSRDDDPMLRTMRRNEDFKSPYSRDKEKTEAERRRDDAVDGDLSRTRRGVSFDNERKVTPRGSSSEKLGEMRTSPRTYSKPNYSSKDWDDDDDNDLFGGGRKKSPYSDSRREQPVRGSLNEREKERDSKRTSFLKGFSKPNAKDTPESSTPRQEKRPNLMDFISGSSESKSQQPALSKTERDNFAKNESNRLSRTSPRDRMSKISPRDTTDLNSPRKTSMLRKTDSSSSLDKTQPIPKQRFRRQSSPRRSPETSVSKEKDADSGRQSPDVILPGDAIKPPNLRDNKGKVDTKGDKDRPESPSSFCDELEREPSSVKEEEAKRRREIKRRQKELLKQTAEHQQDGRAIYEVTDAQATIQKDSSNADDANQKKKRLTASQLFTQVPPKIQTRIPSAKGLKRSESLGENMIYTDSTSIRDSVYEQWYFKRMEEEKKKRQEDKKKKEEEEKKKLEEDSQKKADREMAYKTWADSKKNFVPSYKKKEKEEQKRKEKEDKEKREKEEEAKKAFDMWAEKKKEKDKEILSQKRDQKNKEKEKEREINQKKKESENAYESWNKKKKEKISEETKEKRLKHEAEIAETSNTRREKSEKSREAYLLWEQKKRENDSNPNQHLQSTYPRKPWRPSSANGPKRVPLCMS